MLDSRKSPRWARIEGKKSHETHGHVTGLSHVGYRKRGKMMLQRRARRLTVFWWGTGAVSLGHSVGNHLIPFLLGLSVEKCNNGNGHVVATNTSSLTVRGQAVVHHVLADLGQLLLRGNATTDKLDDCLRRLTVPDTYIIHVSQGLRLSAGADAYRRMPGQGTRHHHRDRGR